LLDRVNTLLHSHLDCKLFLYAASQLGRLGFSHTLHITVKSLSTFGLDSTQ